jgi:hypothetical protein
MTGFRFFWAIFFGLLFSELLSELLFLGTILFTGYHDFLEEGHNLYTPPFTPFPLLRLLIPPLPLQLVNSL